MLYELLVLLFSLSPFALCGIHKSREKNLDKNTFSLPIQRFYTRFITSAQIRRQERENPLECQVYALDGRWKWIWGAKIVTGTSSRELLRHNTAWVVVARAIEEGKKSIEKNCYGKRKHSRKLLIEGFFCGKMSYCCTINRFWYNEELNVIKMCRNLRLSRVFPVNKSRKNELRQQGRINLW